MLVYITISLASTIARAWLSLMFIAIVVFEAWLSL